MTHSHFITLHLRGQRPRRVMLEATQIASVEEIAGEFTEITLSSRIFVEGQVVSPVFQVLETYDEVVRLLQEVKG